MREAVVVIDGQDCITGDLVTLHRLTVHLGGGYYRTRAPIAGGARPALRPVPTLDQLVRNLQLLDGLALATLIDLEAQVGHLGIALRAQITRQMATRSLAHQTTPSHPDRAVRLQEAASLLGMSRDYLYRSWDQLGGYKDDDGKIRFPMATIQRHVNGRR